MNTLSGKAIQRLIDSRLGIALSLLLGRLLPRHLGYYLARQIASWLAGQNDSPTVRAIRANQWVIRGENLLPTALQQAVQETLCSTAYALFDLYHFFSAPQATQRLLVLDSTTQRLIRRAEYEKQGLAIGGLHMSAFDLALQWLCRQGMRPLILTIPNPQGGRRMEYEMRRKAGMNLVPTSLPSLRQAIHHLRQGGLVLTGIDRPVENPGLRPRFFGRPSALPTHLTYLALKAEVPVMVIAARREDDGKYHIYTSDEITLDSQPGDRDQEVLENTERILSVAETFIRQAPNQWSISLPVWPEVMDTI